MNTAGGNYRLWLLPIADTPYTFLFALGANTDALNYLETHARFERVFRHLIESVRIEPLTPVIDAEMNALERDALAIVRLKCLARKNALPWCKDLPE